MLTLQQIKTAYGASSSVNHNTFAIRDYILYLIYENTFGSGSGTAETLTSSNVTSGAASPVPACKCVTFETSEDFAGTINGITRQPSRAYTFRANGNDTLQTIPYTCTAGSINIDIQA